MTMMDAQADTIAISKDMMYDCAMAGMGDIDSFKECLLFRYQYPNTDITNLKQRLQDIADCLAFPNGEARISVSGNLCVVWNVSDETNGQGSPSLNAYAIEHGGIPYIEFCATDKCPNISDRSYSLLKIVTGSVHMYVMRFAYLAALQECTQRGGTLSLEPGKKHDVSPILCTIEDSIDVMTQRKCDAMQTPWPVGWGDNNWGEFSETGKVTVNGKVVSSNGRCQYTPNGMYYVAKDLPGKCMDFMVEDPVTGHCMCRYGYEGDPETSECNRTPK